MGLRKIVISSIRLSMPPDISMTVAERLDGSSSLEMLMAKPEPFSVNSGLGRNEAKRPILLAQTFTMSLNAIMLSAASRSPEALKRISFWPGPFSW